MGHLKGHGAARGRTRCEDDKADVLPGGPEVHRRAVTVSRHGRQRNSRSPGACGDTKIARTIDVNGVAVRVSDFDLPSHSLIS
jgi:hypothetical protein